MRSLGMHQPAGEQSVLLRQRWHVCDGLSRRQLGDAVRTDCEPADARRLYEHRPLGLRRQQQQHVGAHVRLWQRVSERQHPSVAHGYFSSVPRYHIALQRSVFPRPAAESLAALRVHAQRASGHAGHGQCVHKRRACHITAPEHTEPAEPDELVHRPKQLGIGSLLWRIYRRPPAVQCTAHGGAGGGGLRRVQRPAAPPCPTS